jgi:hypothetical protein
MRGRAAWCERFVAAAAAVAAAVDGRRHSSMSSLPRPPTLLSAAHAPSSSLPEGAEAGLGRVRRDCDAVSAARPGRPLSTATAAAAAGLDAHVHLFQAQTTAG